MRLSRVAARSTAWLAIALLVEVASLGPAHAALETTQRIAEAQRADAARARVEAVLEREEIRDEFVRLGIDPAEASARVAALSDAEVEALDGRIQSLPAGADSFVTVLLIVLVVFLFLVITDILGLTDVFTFTKKPGQRGSH